MNAKWPFLRSLFCVSVCGIEILLVRTVSAATSVDKQNRCFFSHLTTCSLPRRYDSFVAVHPHRSFQICRVFSTGYDTWWDTKKSEVILNESCQTSKLPVYTSDYQSLVIDDARFDCDSECVDVAQSLKVLELAYLKLPHESPAKQIRQNSAITALDDCRRQINAVSQDDSSIVLFLLEQKPASVAQQADIYYLSPSPRHTYTHPHSSIINWISLI